MTLIILTNILSIFFKIIIFMNYKSIYSLQKCEADILSSNAIDDDYFKSNIDKYSCSPYRYLDDDDEYLQFKQTIKKGAKGLNICSEDEQVLQCLSCFVNSEFYIRCDIQNILLKYKTYDFLVDLININPNNQFPFPFDPSELQVHLIEESFKIMLHMTSKYTELITKKFYELRYIDIFFQNMNYYRSISDISFCRGINIITNLLHDLPIFYDQAEFVTMKYLGKTFQFLDSFHELNKDSIQPVFYLIFAFSTSIPSPEQLKLAIKERKITIDEKNRIHKIVIELTDKIINFLENYDSPDSKEATFLFRSLFVICYKYKDICANLFLKHMQPFLNILTSENKESIEVVIDFFRLLYKIQIYDAFQFFNWDAILANLTQNAKWILSFVEMVDELRSDFYLLWENNVYQELIKNFDDFSYMIRCKIVYIFSNLIKTIKPEDCLDYLVKSNILSIFFLLLEDIENEKIIGEILQALKIINSNALSLNQMQLIISQYDECDANCILQNLPQDFSNDLNDIYKAIET